LGGKLTGAGPSPKNQHAKPQRRRPTQRKKGEKRKPGTKGEAKDQGLTKGTRPKKGPGPKGPEFRQEFEGNSRKFPGPGPRGQNYPGPQKGPRTGPIKPGNYQDPKIPGQGERLVTGPKEKRKPRESQGPSSRNRGTNKVLPATNQPGTEKPGWTGQAAMQKEAGEQDGVPPSAVKKGDRRQRAGGRMTREEATRLLEAVRAEEGQPVFVPAPPANTSGTTGNW